MRAADMRERYCAVFLLLTNTNFCSMNKELHSSGEKNRCWTAVLPMMQETNHHYVIRDEDTIFYRSAELLYI